MEKSENKVTPVKTTLTKAEAPVKKDEVKDAVKAPVVETPAVKTPVAKAAAPEAEKKEVEEKVTEKKVTEKKPAAKKPVEKRTVKKAEEKIEKIEEVFVQFADQELDTKAILERARQVYISEGHRESSIKSIRLYIKPEEKMAYYVINDKIAGGVPV